MSRIKKKIPKSVYIPKGFKLAPSTVKNAGLGIFTTKNLPAEYNLGKYRGLWLTPEQFNRIKGNLYYVWEINDFPGNTIRPKGKEYDSQATIGYIDGGIKKHSNYLRYLNHPTKKSEENVYGKQIGTDIYYFTSRQIKAGEELMINYGPTYSKVLLGKVI